MERSNCISSVVLGCDECPIRGDCEMCHDLDSLC